MYACAISLAILKILFSTCVIVVNILNAAMRSTVQVSDTTMLN